MGSLLLTAGAPGCRTALPNARIMIHQPSGGAQVRRGACRTHGRVAPKLNRLPHWARSVLCGVGLGQRHCDPGQGDPALAGVPERAVRQAHQAAAERHRYGRDHPLARRLPCWLTCARRARVPGRFLLQRPRSTGTRSCRRQRRSRLGSSTASSRSASQRPCRRLGLSARSRESDVQYSCTKALHVHSNP